LIETIIQSGIKFIQLDLIDECNEMQWINYNLSTREALLDALAWLALIINIDSAVR
jgi:hypothetical protein